MTSPVERIAEVRSGVFKIVLLRDSGNPGAPTEVGWGTGFLVAGGFITNDHVLPDAGFEFAKLIFDDGKTSSCVGLSELNQGKLAVSRRRDPSSCGQRRDYAYVQISRSEFDQRHRFELAPTRRLRCGDPVLYLGYPFAFDHHHLAAHQGHIASIHYDPQIETEVLQIDGSVNPGNSGGPLIDPTTGLVEAIVTENETGIMLREFENLTRMLQENIDILSRTNRAKVSFSGVDLDGAFRATQQALLQISQTLRRSANVGIGYAFVIDHIRDKIARL